MKKLYYIVYISLFFLSGCSFLDVIPDNVATEEMVYNTRTTAERALATCYSRIPEHPVVERNPGLIAGDEVFYYTAEGDYYIPAWSSLKLSRGGQNNITPCVNFWDGHNGGYNMFQAIRNCNNFLEGMKANIPGLYPNEKKIWIAEAKVLKAYYYYWLLQLYGPIPIMDKNLSVDAAPSEMRLERRPVDEVVSYIVDLIDDAIDDEVLPPNILNLLADCGHITLPIAKAIKAKVLVLAASPLFNGNADYTSFKSKEGEPLVSINYDPNKWIIARDACLDAIQTAEAGGHKLYEFNDVLPNGELNDDIMLELKLRATITDRYNKEILWAAGNSQGLQDFCQPAVLVEHISHTGNIKNTHAPTLNVVETFYSSNGVPIEEDKTWNYAKRYEPIIVNNNIAKDHPVSIQNNYTTARLHTYREPRFYAYIGFDGGKWYAIDVDKLNNIPTMDFKVGGISGKKGLDRYSGTGYSCKKLVNYKNVITKSSSINEGYQLPIIRLSDLYLLYAEAANETMEAPDKNVYEYIQRVRHKAGLDKNSNLEETWRLYSNNPNKPKTKEGMRDIIRQERMIELCFEGPRFWDLRRWKLAEDYLSRSIRGWNINAKTSEDFYNPLPLSQYNYLQKHYLWPISQSEMLRNEKLVQSYGW